jgi:hypothetical protein
MRPCALRSCYAACIRNRSRLAPPSPDTLPPSETCSELPLGCVAFATKTSRFESPLLYVRRTSDKKIFEGEGALAPLKRRPATAARYLAVTLCRFRL